MDKLFIDPATLTAIGDAIRAKEESRELIPAVEMADRIRNLPSGTTEPTFYCTFDKYGEPVKLKLGDESTPYTTGSKVGVDFQDVFSSFLSGAEEIELYVNLYSAAYQRVFPENLATLVEGYIGGADTLTVHGADTYDRTTKTYTWRDVDVEATLDTGTLVWK